MSVTTASSPPNSLPTSNPVSAMKPKLLVLSCLVLVGTVRAQSIVTESLGVPNRNLRVLYYDDSFLFAGRHFGDSRDFAGNTEPALFVHSKVYDLWLRIVKVSTKGGTFGSSMSEDKEDQAKLARISVSWNFTSLATRDYADMPLITSGSIAFPRIELQDGGQTYRLGFMAEVGVESAATYLYISRADLETEFAKTKLPNQPVEATPTSQAGSR